MICGRRGRGSINTVFIITRTYLTAGLTRTPGSAASPPASPPARYAHADAQDALARQAAAEAGAVVEQQRVDPDPAEEDRRAVEVEVDDVDVVLVPHEEAHAAPVRPLEVVPQEALLRYVHVAAQPAARHDHVDGYLLLAHEPRIEHLLQRLHDVRRAVEALEHHHGHLVRVLHVSLDVVDVRHAAKEVQVAVDARLEDGVEHGGGLWLPPGLLLLHPAQHEVGVGLAAEGAPCRGRERAPHHQPDGAPLLAKGAFALHAHPVDRLAG
eukprot:666943-Hanusia_phi.AAC.2